MRFSMKFNKVRIQPLKLIYQFTWETLDRNPCPTEFGFSSAENLWIGIQHSNVYSPNSTLNYSLRTRYLARTSSGTRLKRYEQFST